MAICNENFRAVNSWLGWGDPAGGLWFIGMEEGKEFTKEIVASMKGKRFAYAQEDEEFGWPVANKTASIVAKLTGMRSPDAYRDAKLWREGSKVFNGNILPLGKPRRESWPKSYQELFGLTQSEYRSGYSILKEERCATFREFRRNYSPQAIVCFGKGFWRQFERLFVDSKRDRVEYSECMVVIHEDARVILTGHFSYGRWMPNKSVDLVVRTLRKWNITLPA